MAKSSLATLRNALEKPAPVEELKPEAAPAKRSYQAPSRAGKLHISAWLSPNYKKSLRAIQMQHPNPNVKLEELLAEALNELFVKYNVPTVRED
jgi:hypothetical protein